MANVGLGDVLFSFCIAAGVGRELDTYVCSRIFFGSELVCFNQLLYHSDKKYKIKMTTNVLSVSVCI